MPKFSAQKNVQKVSVVIPVYNESRVLNKTIHALMRKLKKFHYKFEIYVADDGSTDLTPLIATRLTSKLRKVKFYRNPKNRGRGEILSEVFPKCSSDLILFMDADLSTDLKHLKQLIGYLKDYDVVTGSRWLQDSKVSRSTTRKMISRIYNIAVRLVFDSKIHDHQCGFKGFRRKVILDLIKDAETKETRLWAWDTEILLRAQRKNYSIKEFPVDWKNGDESKFNFLKDSFTVARYLAHLHNKLD